MPKAKIKGVSGGHIVAVVTCYIKWMTATCLPMTGNFYDIVVVASLVKQWWYLSFIQSISVRKVLETTKTLTLQKDAHWL